SGSRSLILTSPLTVVSWPTRSTTAKSMREPAGSASRLTREKPTASRTAISVRSKGETICHTNKVSSRIGMPMMIHVPADRRALFRLCVKLKPELPAETELRGRTVAAATIRYSFLSRRRERRPAGLMLVERVLHANLSHEAREQSQTRIDLVGARDCFPAAHSAP